MMASSARRRVLATHGVRPARSRGLPCGSSGWRPACHGGPALANRGLPGTLIGSTLGSTPGGCPTTLGIGRIPWPARRLVPWPSPWLDPEGIAIARASAGSGPPAGSSQLAARPTVAARASTPRWTARRIRWRPDGASPGGRHHDADAARTRPTAACPQEWPIIASRGVSRTILMGSPGPQNGRSP